MSPLNRYLKKEYQPYTLEAEQEDWELLTPESGEVPALLEGYFLRNSSNPQHVPNNKYHWFDGDGFIQGVRFVGGKAYFKGRFVRTQKFQEEQIKGQSVHGGLRGPISANSPVKGTVRALEYAVLGSNPFANTSNTDLVYHNHRLLSLWMLCGEAYEIDIQTLETKGQYNFDNGQQKIEHGISAHPAIHPSTGALYVMDFVAAWNRLKKPHLYLSSISKEGKQLATQKIPISGRHLLHDMAITENYVVLLDMPAEMTATGLKYRKERGTHFGLVPTNFEPITDPRTGKKGPVLWFHDPSGCYIIHVVNAYEEDGKVVLFALRKPQLTLTTQKGDNLSDAFAGYLHKWVFDVATGTIESQTGTDYRPHLPFGSEFPTLHPDYEGRKNRYAYLPGVAERKVFNFDSFAKYDHETNTYERYVYPEQTFVSELRFVPHPQADGVEDRGWLVAFVHQLGETPEDAPRVWVEVFDAQQINDGPVVRLPLSKPIPIGFHTTWVGAAELPY